MQPMAAALCKTMFFFKRELNSMQIFFVYHSEISFSNIFCGLYARFMFFLEILFSWDRYRNYIWLFCLFSSTSLFSYAFLIPQIITQYIFVVFYQILLNVLVCKNTTGLTNTPAILSSYLKLKLILFVCFKYNFVNQPLRTQTRTVGRRGALTCCSPTLVDLGGGAAPHWVLISLVFDLNVMTF